MSILSWNVNGLRDVDKMKTVFATARNSFAKMICLQETFWDDQFIRSYEHLWDGKIIFNNCPYEHRKGVAILISPLFAGDYNVAFKDDDGRVLKVNFTFDDCTIDIFNVYLPNKVCERSHVWRMISPLVVNPNSVIVGDLNDILDPRLDKASNVKTFNLQGCETLQRFIDNHNLCDVWRYKHPDKREFTRQQFVEGVLKQSRIDMFLISRSLLVNVVNCFIKYTTLSDHNMVFLKLDMSRVERGSGVWILNNTLLEDPAYCLKIRDFIRKDVDCPLFELEPLMWWDNLKSKIKRLSICFATSKRKGEKNEYYHLQNSLRREYDRASKNSSYDYSIILDLEAKLQDHELKACKGAILRSKAQWALESDKCTSFFLNLEKRRQESNCIRGLISESGYVTSSEGILDCCHKFYSSLYMAEQVNGKDQDTLLDLLDCPLDEEGVASCDRPISQDELTTALNGMKCNKSPGIDGLTVEFYRKFWDVIKPLFHKIISCIHQSNELSRSMKKGIISLFYKKRGDKLNLKNYRPISLLCVDYKLLSRVLALRLKQVLSLIVSDEQTSSIPGRCIMDNVLGVAGVIDYVEDVNDEAYLVKIDQEKAFDRVSHEFLFKVLRKFNFGPNFRSLVKLLYNGIRSCIKCNGHLSGFFPVTRSVRQGCPISPMLYCLVAEPLNRLLKRSLSSSSVLVSPSCRSLLFQHADDTSVTVNNSRAVCDTFRCLDLYSSGSGSKVNLEKSEVLLLGSAKHQHLDLHLPVQVKRDAVEVLGIHLGPDKKLCETLNWTKKVSSIKSLLGLWTQRRLSLHGKAVVLNTLIVSRLWYLVTAQHVPVYVETELRKAFKDFLWPSKCVLIKASTVIGVSKDGGLNVSDIGLKKYALRLKLLKKVNDSHCGVVWKHVLLYFFSKYADMNLQMNLLCIMYQRCHLQRLPLFYRDLLNAWNSINSNFRVMPDNIVDIMHQPLFFNPHVLCKGKSIYFDFFIRAKLVTVADICYEVLPKFLPSSSIVEIVSDCCPDKSESLVIDAYNVLLCSVPLPWRKCILSEIANPNPRYNINWVTTDDKIESVDVFSAKFCYSYLVKQVFQPPTSYEMWDDCMLNFEWPKVWRNILSNYLPADCRDLDFRIAHNVVYTQEKLYKIGKTVDNLCPVCKSETEDMFHLFTGCSELDSVIGMCKFVFEDVCRDTGFSQHDLVSWLLFGYHPEHPQHSTDFIDLFLSTYRLAVFKRRNVATMDGKIVDVKKLFTHLMNAHLSYICYQFKRVNRYIHFIQKYVMCTSLLTLNGDDHYVLNYPFC